MNKIILRALVAVMAGLAVSPASAWRGGFGGGGFVARGPAGGFAAGGWHAGGAAGWGGTWHGDGYHAAGAWGGYGYHGPVVVNSYYGGGCYACGAAAVGAAVGTAAAVNAVANSYAIGATLATLPTGCMARVVNGGSFYVCNGSWLAPRYGNNGLYYVVVDPM